MKDTSKLTPLMQQYWEIKAHHTDKVLLFRMGDFFEMFHEDALIAAPILGIALTQRNKKSAEETPMCGVPHHSIAGPIAKLLATGHKVAICDQVEDPKFAKGIVKRAVTRILSPGMVYDPDTLDQLHANYLCAYDSQTVAFLDASAGDAFYYRLTAENDLRHLMDLLNPAEIVLSAEQKGQLFTDESTQDRCLTVHEFNFENLAEKHRSFPLAAQRLVAYATAMQGEEFQHSISTFEERYLQRHLELSPTVIRQLELFESYKGDLRGSLFFAINRAKTSAGARLLKNWLRFPLADGHQIEERWKNVAFWTGDPVNLKRVRQILSGMGDIERRLGKIANPNCNARDLVALAQSLQVGLSLSEFCPHLKVESSTLITAQELEREISSTIVEEAPLAVKEGGLIRKGAFPHLDELIQLAEESQKVLMEMESREKEVTGIPSLKIRYNSVFGYYIEITNAHKNKVPDHYKRKQTLANAERYLTQELQQLEENILAARSRRADVEFEIFQALRKKVLSRVPDLLALSRRWSEVDVFSSLAWLALEHNYCRPQLSQDSSLFLKSSRHPVVEQEVKVPFVPNTIHLARGECLLLTGPNMAGKSTLMRQAAVSCILAQMGSFVPAEQAAVPVLDRVFTRIGASDYLSEGLSTFMVEMKETAEMLSRATPRSLVILDEIGRGTSTYDGLSLAQAILEHIVNKLGSITFFATHYHELTSLDRQFPQIKNCHMAIREKAGDIQFLHTLTQGPANKSYGIQVARLAGLPSSLTARAKVLLERHESFGPVSAQTHQQQMSLMDIDSIPEAHTPEEWKKLVEEIMSTQWQQMTPLEALNTIAKWQRDLS